MVSSHTMTLYANAIVTRLPARFADEMAFLPAAQSLQDTPVHPAPGRIIVSDRTKLIQPLEASVVKKVLVKDGDRVHEQLKTQASELLRTHELLQLLSKQKLPAPVLRAQTAHWA